MATTVAIAFALHGGGEVGQRALGIGDDDLRDVRVDHARDQRSGDAGLRGLADVVVTVEALALERDEQRRPTLGQGAGVGGDGLDGAVRTVQEAAGHARDVGEQARRSPGGPPALRGRPACRRTGVARPGCPGMARGPCRPPARCRRRPAVPTACTMAAARSRCTIARPGCAKPARMSATMASPSSKRGLSSVTTTTSAWRSAIAAICGRLPRSRSPPQPNTQISRARMCARSEVQRLFQRVGRVRVVDHYQRCAAVAAEAVHAAVDRLQLRQRLAPPIRGRIAQREQHARHGQQVVYVEAAQQRRSHRVRFVAGDQVEADPGVVEAQVRRAQRRVARVARADADGAHAGRERGDQLAAEGVVEVDHRRPAGPATRTGAPWPRRRSPCRRDSPGGRE